MSDVKKNTKQESDIDSCLAYVCPSCRKGKLYAAPKKQEENGILKCETCDTRYPVINQIPRLVDVDNYSESFGYQWNIFSKTQLDSYSGIPVSRKRLEAVTSWDNKLLKGQLILEAGSGAGRFTEILVGTEADIYSFDYSKAVDANFKNNGEARNLALFQGDIFNIPFEDDTFDHVFCLGVIQHTPDPEAAFFSLASKVKPGGMIYIDVYTQSWYHYLHWKYILRPITKRVSQEKLYTFLSKAVPLLIPPARLLRKAFGRVGA